MIPKSAKNKRDKFIDEKISYGGLEYSPKGNVVKECTRSWDNGYSVAREELEAQVKMLEECVKYYKKEDDWHQLVREMNGVKEYMGYTDNHMRFCARTTLAKLEEMRK